jgi:hypothetical protein
MRPFGVAGDAELLAPPLVYPTPDERRFRRAGRALRRQLAREGRHDCWPDPERAGDLFGGTPLSPQLTDPIVQLRVSHKGFVPPTGS